MQFSSKNQRRIKQLLSIIDPSINWQKHDTSTILEISMDIDVEDNNLLKGNNLLKLIKSDFWPLAVNPDLIVKDNHQQRQHRANSIIDVFVRSKLTNNKFLDFGCGFGECVHAAAQKETKTSVGFDIKPHDIWNNLHGVFTIDWDVVRENGPYDIVLLYDVIDHIIDEDERANVFHRIKSVLNTNAKVFVRCHPFTSRHGTHLYKKLNKAYAHLFLTPEDLIVANIGEEDQSPTHLTLRPKAVYHELFNHNGFTIESEEVIIEEPEELILSLADKIYHFWKDDRHGEYVKDSETLRNVIHQQFIDYVIVSTGT